MYVLENFKILRYYQGNYVLYTEREFLENIRKSQGQAGRPVIRENIHWIPHRDGQVPVGGGKGCKRRE
jgi:hypothetical protein